jgi:hypothetical protein
VCLPKQMSPRATRHERRKLVGCECDKVQDNECEGNVAKE